MDYRYNRSNSERGPSDDSLRLHFDDFRTTFPMDDRYKRIHSDLTGLHRQLWEADYELYDCLTFHCKTFDEEFRFLSTFLYSIHVWSDADKVFPSLESLVLKIQATMSAIGNALKIARKNNYRESCCLDCISAFEKCWKLDELIIAARRKDLEKRASGLILMFSNLIGMIEHLKPEIREAYEDLSSHSFQLYYPISGFAPWDNTIRFIEVNLHILSEKDNLLPPVRKQIQSLEKWLKSARKYFLYVEMRYDPKYASAHYSGLDAILTDLKNLAGAVAICTAHVSCLWWIDKIERYVANDLPFDLEQKLDPASVEFFELNLRLLRHLDAQECDYSYLMSEFVHYLLDGDESRDLCEHMRSLIISVFNVPEEDLRTLLPEIISVARKARPLMHFPREWCENYPEFFKLLARIWLINIETSLRELNTGYISTLSANKQSKALLEAPNILEKLSRNPPEENPVNGTRFLMLVEAVAREVASFGQSSHANEITRNLAPDLLFELLSKIMLFKAEAFLMDLLDSNASLMIQMKDQIETLQEGFILLKSFVMKPPEEYTEDKRSIFKSIQALAKGVRSLFYSYPADKITSDTVKEINPLLFDFLEKLNVIRAKIKEIYLPAPRFKAPKTNGLGFIDFLLRNLREMLSCNSDPITFMRRKIEELPPDLEFIRSFLKDTVHQNIENHELKDLGAYVLDVAYELEFVIDLIRISDGTDWKNVLWFYHVQEEIKLVKCQVMNIEEKSCDVRVDTVIQISRNRMSQTSTPGIDESIVGLNDQEEVLIDLLRRGSLERDIVSIVGMPGIGKTTMAKKVYNHPEVLYHFHIRAWCCISQVYVKRDLLLDILSHVTGLTENILGMADEDLELKLYQCLKRKRYLIVMDDMWDTKAWKYLENSFPSDANGSRILLTSRLHDVALGVKPSSDPYQLRLLSDVESWDLLQMKIFHGNGCPEVLMEVGMQIARNCKGLPLAIVAIAGLLESSDKQQDWWNEIAESLSSKLFDDPTTRCMDILELSYKHLPDHLKACFLYFGAFVEDKVILARRLIQLWIAEGFIDKIDSKSLEDLAEEYLLDLISRSLVIVSQRRSSGGVKACHIHDMLRDLCLLKAKEDNFLQQITQYDELHTSVDGLDYGIALDDAYPSNSVRYEDHRLCIYSKRKHFVMSRPSGPRVRSLLFFAAGDKRPSCPYDVSFIFYNFKLLKVLDLKCINVGSTFPCGVELLVHLRYLAISGDIDSVPSSIGNLRYLEIFIVKGLKGKVELPDTIWCMARLRHVCVTDCTTFCLQDDCLRNSSQLANLVTLSSLYLSCGEDSEKLLKRFPNLKNLRCIFSKMRDYSGKGNQFPRLDILTRLESLKIFYTGEILHSFEFSFPSSLTKLTLSNFRLPWDHISAVGKLQNLEVLKLLSRAFEGEIWEMTEGEFSKLKVLKLDSLNFVKWDAYPDHLPNLLQLVLRSCKDLEEVPSSLGEIPSLQLIEIQSCGVSVEESVKLLEEENEGLKVFINRSYTNFR